MNDEDCENDPHPLTNIGAILQNRIEDVGNAFALSGSAWLAKDWDGVTGALGEASSAISHHVLCDPCASADVVQAWTLIAQELKDISTIEGCSSVGPPASIPNWVSIQSTLRRLAATDSRNTSVDWMERAIAEIDRLLDSI
jgi:hypothetical protein